MACPPRDEPLVGFTEDRTPTHQRVRGGDGGVCLAAGELASRSQLDEASARPPPGAHFRCDVGRGDLPESNPAPRAPMEPSSPREGSAQERLAQGVRAFRD
jgi:hypothetical protein